MQTTLKNLVASALFAVTLIPITASATNDLGLLWETNTYTPPFYQGRALPSPGSTVRVIAFPTGKNGQVVQTENLEFVWEKDFRLLTSASGQGRDTLTFRAENGPHKVKVTVDSTTLSRPLSQTITIPVNSPEVLLYEDDPLLGVNYNQSIPQNIELLKSEITLVAEPYFFSLLESKTGKLEYSWLLNDKQIITDPANQPRVTLLKPSGGTGENELEIIVRNLDAFLQRASFLTVINFDAGSDFGGF